MANVIKIKRSTSQATPTSLAEGELAYSEVSKNLFIGTNSGADVTVIGGQEGIQDEAAALVTGGSHTGISATYTDGAAGAGVLGLALTADPTISLGGDLSGSVTLTNLASSTFTLTSTIGNDKVAAAELGVTAGTATASKALVVDANKDINLGTGDITATNVTGTLQTAAQGNVTSVGTLTGLTVDGDATIADGTNDFDVASHDGTNGLKLGGTLVTSSAAELNLLDGITAGTASASKALIVDSNKDINLGSGDITATNVTGTLQTAAQGNITSVGDLNGLTIAASQTISAGANAITNVADPSNDQDAATKAYVDAVKTGLDVKGSVRVATTATGTLASSFANGQSVDGVTLATGDRILVKDQGTGSENGIYTVNASGAPTRATDFDSNTEVTGGAFTFVEEGTTNSDSGWVMSNNGAVTVGSTALTFSQFSGAGQISAGGGMTKSGNTLDVVAGTGITVNANDVQISATYAGQPSITTLGIVTTGIWSADTIAVNKGGLGMSSYTAGDMLYASGTTAVSKLAKGTAGQMMVMNSGATAPSWTSTLDGGTF